MKRVICDNAACRKEEAPDSYGLSPKGWVKVEVRGSVKEFGLDFCSKPCAIKYLGGTVPEEQPAVSDAEHAPVHVGGTL